MIHGAINLSINELLGRFLIVCLRVYVRNKFGWSLHEMHWFAGRVPSSQGCLVLG